MYPLEHIVFQLLKRQSYAKPSRHIFILYIFGRMEDKSYLLEGSSLNYTMEFEGDLVHLVMIRRLKSCRFDQITKVELKKYRIAMGDEVKIRIYFTDQGREKKFPWVPFKVISEGSKEFLDDLRSRLSPLAVWEDRRDELSIQKNGQKVYDLQYILFGYTGAGLPRSFQLWLYLVGLGVLVLPLIYYGYIIAKGGYRIYIADEALTLRKFRSFLYRWDDLKVEFRQVNVVQDYVVSTSILKVVLIGSGRKKKVLMRYDHALPLIKELVSRGVVDPATLPSNIADNL